MNKLILTKLKDLTNVQLHPSVDLSKQVKDESICELCGEWSHLNQGACQSCINFHNVTLDEENE